MGQLRLTVALFNFLGFQIPALIRAIPFYSPSLYTPYLSNLGQAVA
jgi:hypothetical protein